jgi:hypothetical protein
MNTTTTKIAGEDMTDEWRAAFDERHEFDVYPEHFMSGMRNEFAAGWHAALKSQASALLESKTAVPWIAHWSGSNPYKGWSIRQGRDEVIWFGETISSETVEGIVLAHNKCFDCDGTGCVMNCSGLLPTAPAQCADYSQCCDSPAFCSSVRRCTAKDATAPAQSCGDAEQADEAVTDDAERYRLLRRKVCIVGDKFQILNLDPTYVAPDAAIELDASLDAARAKDSK